MEKIKTDAKMRFYTGITSVALFNTINQTVYTTYHQLESTKTCHANFKKNWKEKNVNIIKPPWLIYLRLMRLRLGLLNKDVEDHFDISPTKSSLIFIIWIKLLTKLLKNLVPGYLEKQFEIICLKHLLKLGIINVESF